MFEQRRTIDRIDHDITPCRPNQRRKQRIVPAVLADCQRQTRSGIDPWIERAASGGVPNLHDAARYHLCNGGKRLRSALVFLVGSHLGTSDAQLAPFAAAIELTHDASLVHDDIQDGDVYRRGQLSVWARYGTPHAINVGDLLIIRAFQCLSQLPAAQLPSFLEYFSQQLARVSEGQALDLNLRADRVPTEDTYLEVARLKTVPLIELALSGAARLAGAHQAIVSALESFAEALGLTFQIRDDLLDLFHSDDGPPGRDLAAGARSFPVCYALNRLPAPERAALAAQLSSPGHRGDDEVSRLLELVRCAEVVDGVRAAAHRVAAGATAATQRLPGELRRSLQAVLDGLLETM